MGLSRNLSDFLAEVRGSIGLGGGHGKNLRNASITQTS